MSCTGCAAARHLADECVVKDLITTNDINMKGARGCICDQLLSSLCHCTICLFVVADGPAGGKLLVFRPGYSVAAGVVVPIMFDTGSRSYHGFNVEKFKALVDTTAGLGRHQGGPQMLKVGFSLCHEATKERTHMIRPVGPQLCQELC